MKLITNLIIELELPEEVANEIKTLIEDEIKHLCSGHLIDIKHSIRNGIFIEDDSKLKIDGETIIEE